MDNNKDRSKNKIPLPKNPKFNYYWLYAIIAVLIIGLNVLNISSPSAETDELTFFKDMAKSGDVAKIVVVNEKDVQVYIKKDSLQKEEYKKVAESALGGENPGPHYNFEIVGPDRFMEKLEKENQELDKPIPFYSETQSSWTDSIAYLLPLILIVGFWIFIMRRVSGGGGGAGGQIFNIGKSKATLFDNTKVNVTFKDVAGLDEAKEEVMEVVDFLKNPKKYTTLGGKIPKGALLVGPPGTGKTLMAKAVAGEAQVPFFSISGSDFVEMFVGVGASRVRDLFRQAREKAPCIIFIDEIDAIGRARGKNLVQGNDERENTLNQLLVEMDGFGTDSGVIILAATNRPDVLDSALLRPGRFDRQITVDKPDLIGREQIFNVHLKGITLSKDIDAKKLAAQTPGFAGAEIANVCNEAALIAARRNKTSVEMQDFNEAVDRVIGGLEKKNKLISPDEKKVVAYHEAGHALCGWFLPYADPLVKVSIVPRGIAALGYAQYLPKEQYLYSTEQLMDSMTMTLGGRAAEELIFGRITTGAQNDLERVTKVAYSMITIYGMNERVGNVSFNDPQGEYNFKKPYSEDTAKVIDEEVKKLIDDAYQRAKKLLKEKMVFLESVAQELLEKEIIYKDDLERLIGKRMFDDRGQKTEAAKTAEETKPAESSFQSKYNSSTTAEPNKDALVKDHNDPNNADAGKTVIPDDKLTEEPPKEDPQ